MGLNFNRACHHLFLQLTTYSDQPSASIHSTNSETQFPVNTTLDRSSYSQHPNSTPQHHNKRWHATFAVRVRVTGTNTNRCCARPPKLSHLMSVAARRDKVCIQCTFALSMAFSDAASVVLLPFASGTTSASCCQNRLDSIPVTERHLIRWMIWSEGGDMAAGDGGG